METIETDICIIGAGSGGLSVAAGAAQMGARVVLVEGGRMGGDCLNTGCVPSKALLAAARVAHDMTHGAPFGIASAAPQIGFSAVKDHVAGVIAAIAPHDSQERVEGLGVTVLRDWARFTGPREIEAGGKAIHARRFVIATGSSPLIPKVPGLEDIPYFTNETIFDLRDRPDHLLILGAGTMGVEMAQAHRRLGSEVTVIEAGRGLSREDADCAALVLDALRAEGVRIVEGATVTRVQGEQGDITVETDGARFAGTHLLVATGRKPNVELLDLAAAGVKTTDAGIAVDAMLRTSNRRVYAIGDVTGGQANTHVAGYQAGVVIRSALIGLPAKARADHIPRAVYTEPELAQVGLTEPEARALHGDRLEIVTADFAQNDRAVAGHRGRGLVKVMVLRGRPVGVSIVGPHAGELIGFWALAIANRLKMSAIAGTVLPYPTLMEANKRAVGAYFTPRLFENPRLAAIVRLVQRFLP